MGENESRVFGYARVSTSNQKTDRQVDALMKYGVPKRDIYTDEASGKNFERPQYLSLKSQLRAGDTLVILDLDRLGRNYDDIATEWNFLTKEIGIGIEVLNFPLLSTVGDKKQLESRLISDIVFSLLSYVAEKERKDILKRQAEGIEAAKKRGTRFGRPSVPRPDNFTQVYEQVRRNEITNAQAMALLELKPNTYYRFVKQEKESLHNADL